ncbi:MAG: class I SAM-dependent methyltransferase [Candidatus Dormibacteraeota bacterium]|nr:class I SAM-dependent methyltransferase [Candidatus Dormibacteraeota bacterium]
MDHRREQLRRTFESAADLYDVARPSYPNQLFDDLVNLAKLKPGGRLLEIGCATGKATLPLLERGFKVDCVEIGEQLAEKARRNLAGRAVEIHTESFETWPGASASYDLVYAAAAWHWLDPATRYRKAHDLLRIGGHLAMWSASHAFPDDTDPFFFEIQDVYEAIGESVPKGEWPPAKPDKVPDQAKEILASGLFQDVVVRRYVWEQTYTAEEYIRLLNTFSGHIAMGDLKRSRLYGDIRARIGRRRNPTVRRHWLSILHLAGRSKSAPLRG